MRRAEALKRALQHAEKAEQHAEMLLQLTGSADVVLNARINHSSRMVAEAELSQMWSAIAGALSYGPSEEGLG